MSGGYFGYWSAFWHKLRGHTIVGTVDGPRCSCGMRWGVGAPW
jgi:hypothetical protein